MIRLGGVLRRATGNFRERTSTSYKTDLSTTPSRTRVIFRFDNRFYTNDVEEVTPPPSVLKRVRPNSLPGFRAVV